MTLRALAKALRRRQLRAKLQPAALVRATPDAALIDAYTRCAKCRQPIFADERAAIRNAATPDDFLRICEMGLAAHDCPADKIPSN